jgi:hypothetical protein
MGMVMYVGENGDVYPPDLRTFCKQGLIPESCLKCPSADSSREHDYFYFPATVSESPFRILACDYRDNHDGEVRSVLYLDNHVATLTEEQFQAELAEPYNAEFAKALRAAEGP